MLTNSSSEPIILGVDIGYGNVKVYGSQHRGAEVPQQFHFPALAVPCDELAESGTNFLQAHQVTRVCVDDIEYFVGPDAPRLSFRRLSPQLDRAYSTSREYFALGLGALARSGLAELDILALGLPAMYSDHTELVEGLKARFTGTHEVAGRRIVVKAVNVYSQPVGGMASLAYTKGLMQSLRSKRVLVIDPGFNTVDWTVVDHGRVVRTAKDSTRDGGMAAFLRDLKGRLERAHQKLSISTLYELDEALRGERNLRDDDGVTVDVRPFVERSMATWETPLNDLVSTLGSLGKFDIVFVVGGAAATFRQALAARYPKVQVANNEAPPILAIATGFYVLARHDYLRSAEANGSLPARQLRGSVPAASTRQTTGGRELAHA